MLALVLGNAGAAKLSIVGRAGTRRSITTNGDERWTRPVGAVELLVAAAALVAPPIVSGPLLAVVFALFAVTHAWRLRTGREDCGCFGVATLAPTPAPRAFALTAASAALALAVGVAGPSSLAGLASRHPAGALTVTLVALLGSLGWRLAFTAGPRRARGVGDRPGRAGSVGDRLVNGSALFLERRLSRRTMLLRIAVAGSALTVAPLRYLLYPGSALAAIVPGDCPGGACSDGYTGFCCQINDGLNSCPTGTFPGGWWMCTDYAGRQLCAEQGVRYYVDCNALPNVEVDGGCHCGGGSCGNRRIGCNVFRYGQCNTQIAGVTAVVCRMVVCENPSSFPALNCSGSVAVDNAVCDHEAPCLEPRARQLAGAGGV